MLEVPSKIKKQIGFRFSSIRLAHLGRQTREIHRYCELSPRNGQGEIGFAILRLAVAVLALAQLSGCGVTYNTLPLTVSPSSVSFGAVAVGQTQTTAVTLTNPGLTPVTLSGMQVADSAFQLASSQMQTTIAPGANATVNVTFAPQQAKSYSSQIVIDSGSLQTSVAVSGTGQQISAAPPVSTNPALQVSATALQFGSVPIGGDAQQSLTLTSTGTAPLQITSLAANGSSFTTQAPTLPLTLQPGQALTLPVSFGPTAAGSATGQLVIASNAAQTPSVIVSLAGDGSSSPTAPPPSNTPALTLSSAAVDFGAVAVGSTASQTVTLTSSGTAAVVLQSIAVNGSAFATGQLPLPLTLAPGQQIVLPLSFAPSSAGAQQGQVTLTDNATGSPNAIALTGIATATVPPTAPPPSNTPALTLSSAAVNFGSVAVGSTASQTVTLTSSGTAAVILQSIAVNGSAFTTGQLPLPLTLAPGQQIVLPLSFAPSSAGAQQGHVTLTDNATGSPNTIALTGTTTASASSASLSAPQSVDFGNVTVGAEGSRTVTLVSSGNSPVTVNSIQVAGAVFSASSVVLPQVLQPNQQMSIPVKFDPNAQGSAAGLLTVLSNSATNPILSVQLNGNGVVATAPSLSASAGTLSFGDVPVGSEATKTVTVTSTGTAPATITGGTVTGSAYTVTYAGVPIQNLSAPISLQPGQQITLTAAFDPMANGTAAGQLTLATDTGSPVNVAMIGVGTQNTAPALTASVASLSFGDVQAGATAVQQVTLTSSGTAPVTISASAIAGQGFQIASIAYPAGVNGWPATLNPGQQVVISVSFAPDAAGSFTGDLAIASDASGGSVNIPLNGTGDAAAAPKLTLSATSLNFGQVAIGSQATRTVQLISSGNAPLSITAIDVAGAQFSVAAPSLPVTLQPNQQLSLTVTFSPDTAAVDSGTLTIASNDPSGPATVSLGGMGNATAAPQLSATPAQLAFGNVPVNSPSTQPLTLLSTGSAPVTVTAAAITGAGFTVSGATFPVTLNPNQSVTLQVQFDPSAAGAASGQLAITSNSASGATLKIPLSGVGTAASAAQLTLSANTLSFGNVSLNTTATLPVTLTSTGSAPLTVSAASFAGTGFTGVVPNLPVTLNPNQSLTIEVKFDPTAAGPTSGQLTVSSNSSTGPTSVVQLSGTGTGSTTPQLLIGANSLAFGNVPVGSTSTLSLTLTSSGTAPVTVSSASLTGTGFSDSGVSFPVTLNPNQSVQLQVQFDPTTAAAASGVLTIVSNSSTGGTVQVQLSGTGTASPQQYSVELTWNAPSSSADPAVGYNVYRSADGGSSFTKINPSPEAEVSYTDTAVQDGSSYVYQVTSVDANGVESTPSNQITLAIP